MHFISPPPAALPARDATLPILRGHTASDSLHLAPDFHRHHLWRPLAAFAALMLLLMGAHGDQWLADALYALEGHAWSLQSSYIIQDLLHVGGRQFAKYAWIGVLLVFLVSSALRGLEAWRRPLAYLLASTLLAAVLVSVLKRWTHMDCPWDLLRYGGGNSYYGLFTPRPAGVPSAGCFPAGHASAGYAWVALYFLLLSTRPRLRWWGLGVGIGLGLLFGIAQQLRGAHFLSHDLSALMISWLSALGLYCVMLAPRQRALGGETSA